MSDPKGFKVVKNKWLPKTGDIVRCAKHGAEYVVTSTHRLSETCSCVCIKSSGKISAGVTYNRVKEELAPVPPTEETLAYSQGQFVKMVSHPYAVGVIVYRSSSRILDVLFADGIKQVAAGEVVPFHGTLSVGGDSNV